jgi:hypothetical protein
MTTVDLKPPQSLEPISQLDLEGVVYEPDPTTGNFYGIPSKHLPALLSAGWTLETLSPTTLNASTIVASNITAGDNLTGDRVHTAAGWDFPGVNSGLMPANAIGTGMTVAWIDLSGDTPRLKFSNKDGAGVVTTWEVPLLGA